MRVFLVAVGVLAALLAGAWFLGAAQVEARVEAALEDLAARGWEVEYSDIATSGFPARLDTVVTDLRLAAPDGQVTWAAPVLRVWAPSYSPNRLIAVLPPEQRLSVAGQEMEVSAERLRAGLTVGLALDLPLERATLESGPVTVTSEAGWEAGLERLLATLSRSGTGLAAYDLFAEAEDLSLSTVGAEIGLLRLDARVTLDAPLDRRLAAAPRLLGFALHEVRLAQGEVAVTGTGELVPDAQGYLSGTVTLAVENWRGLLDLLEEAGILVLDQRAFLEAALEQLAQGQNRIEVPLTFANGQVEALGVALLQAPRVL